MPKIPFQNVEHVIYECESMGKLIAIEKEESKKIGAYFKKYRSKKVKPSEKVEGNWFVLDEEYNSLKIDFSTTVKVEIKELKLFPLK